MSNHYISLSEQVAQKISTMILIDHRYVSDQRLPSEAELANELNVSRTSIREAIKILISNNILYIKRGVGTFVKSDAGSAKNPFDIFYSSSKKQMVMDAFEIRLLLEVESAKLAAKRATEEDIREIQEAEKECTNQIEAGLNHSIEDQKFHTAIAKATHNRMLVQIAPVLQMTIDTTLYAYSAVRDSLTRLTSNTLYYHKEILRFIKEKDPEGAGFAMYCHISKIYQSISMIDKEDGK